MTEPLRRRSSELVALSILALGIFEVRPAAPQLLGHEFQVNSHTQLHQRYPAVAGDGSGAFVAAWESDLQDGSYEGVYAQRFDAAGLPAGSEFRVNSYTPQHQFHPAVAMDGAGNFVVVWQSRGIGSGATFGQRYDSAGLPLGGEFQVGSPHSRGFFNSVAADGAGNFVVVWEADDGSYSGIRGRRFLSTGLPAGPEFWVNTYTTREQYLPAVAVDGAGNFVVVWQSNRQDDAWYEGVYAQRFDAAGVPLGSEFRVNSSTVGYQKRPAVAADESGNFVVVWTGQVEGESRCDVFGQRFAATGLPVGGEFRVNRFLWSWQSGAAVTAAPAGDFVVVWSSNDQDGSGSGVFGQRFASTGEPIGGEFRLNSYTTSHQLSPAVVADGAGNFVVAWSSYYEDGSGVGVFGQRGAGPLFHDGFEAGDACAWSEVMGGGCP